MKRHTLDTPRAKMIFNCVCLFLPFHHKWVFLLHGKVRVDLNGIIFILQLQQLRSTFFCYQPAVIDDICKKTFINTIYSYNTKKMTLETEERTVTCGTAFAINSEFA